MTKTHRKKLAAILERLDAVRDDLENFIGEASLSETEHSELEDAYSFLEQAHGAVFQHCEEE